MAQIASGGGAPKVTQITRTKSGVKPTLQTSPAANGWSHDHCCLASNGGRESRRLVTTTETPSDPRPRCVERGGLCGRLVPP